MTSSMHVYGAFAPPSVVVDRALPPPSIVPVAPPAPVNDWGLPLVSTRVELPAPLVWPAPDPELLMSITIAPLRLAPVSWSPPAIRRSTWAAPVPKLDSYDAVTAAANTSVTAAEPEPAASVGRARSARSMAYAIAAVAAAGAGLAVVILSR